MNYPSVNTLKQIAGDRARELRLTIDGTHDLEWLCERHGLRQFHPLEWLTVERIDEIQMAAANVILETYGVEGVNIEGAWFGSFWLDCAGIYCSTGDSYDATLTLDHSGRWRVESWADLVERNEREVRSNG